MGILKSGKVVRCCKDTLIKNSDFFKTMLSHDCLETTTNQMKVDQFKDETVNNFLECLNASRRNCIYEEGNRYNFNYIRNSYYRRNFDKEKLTLELLSLAHFYQVEELQKDCVTYMRSILCDENVMEFLMVAEKFDLKSLKEKAMNHLAERPIRENYLSVPGFAKALASHPHLEDLLMKTMSDKIQELKESQKQLLGDVIKVTVTMLNVGEWTVEKDVTLRSGQNKCMTDCTIGWTETIFVKATNKIQTLLNLLEKRRPSPEGKIYRLAQRFWCYQNKSYKMNAINFFSTWQVGKYSEGKNMQLYAYYGHES